MMLELSELEDLSDHPPIVSDLDVFKQRAIVGGRSCEQ
jgi:hypothetical protein